MFIVVFNVVNSNYNTWCSSDPLVGCFAGQINGASYLYCQVGYTANRGDELNLYFRLNGNERTVHNVLYR
jgi:hypothetical protein